MEGVGKVVCMNVYVICENVISKQPIVKSLKDEGNLQTYCT